MRPDSGDWPLRSRAPFPETARLSPASSASPARARARDRGLWDHSQPRLFVCFAIARALPMARGGLPGRAGASSPGPAAG